MPQISCIVPSPIGKLAIAIENEALVSLSWTDTPPSSIDDPLTQTIEAQLAAYFTDAHHPFDLPLAPKGNTLDQAVWREMLRIPCGETVTYGDIAKILGRPARVVGGACGRNPIPIIIPCHRVVGAGGRMVGYSGHGGIETKRWLLRHEGALLI